MSTIPICMYPTKTLLIDDDILSLKKLDVNLDNTRFTYQKFHDPEKALTYINHVYKQDSFVNRLINQPDESQWQHAMLDVNIYDLMKEIYNPNRFETISTVVVDFAMPGMNGLEVCEKIADKSIQKILLTGEADEQLAVRAFNKGLIHKYIRKQDPDIFNTLNESLLESQRVYFSKISQIMLDVATFNASHSCLKDPEFVCFFENLLIEKNIIEYYLVETPGNFLLIDEESNIYGLFAYNKDQLKMWHEDLSEKDSAPEHLIKELKAHKKMICFHDKNSISIPPGREWEKYSYPLKILNGSLETYYYVCENDILDIEKNKMFTFDKFKDELNKNTKWA